MAKILATVACNLDNDILGACFPLLEAAKVEAIEWSFDALFRVAQVPGWFLDLLAAYSAENRLIGHGVFFSLFSGRWLPEQASWLQHLRATSQAFRFDHVTEHFGFMTGKDFHHGAPLNIPYTASTLRIGQDRLKRIQEACNCPVGLENLAFSYSPEEVMRHGAFLEQLLEPVNGFIILDLHNLYCQIHNFNIPFEEIISLYPLHMVREIHISGGSWESSQAAPGRQVRRDTHDDAVPAEVFRLLECTIPLCPHLKYVVLEQLGSGLASDASKSVFQNDFLKMESMIGRFNTSGEENFLPLTSFPSGDAVEDEALYQQQLELSAILETSSSYDAAIQALHASSLSRSDWRIETWEPYMVETAIRIAQKWKK